MNDHHEIGRGLLHRHALADHRVGQPRGGDRDAILHQHLRLIDIRAGLEHDVDRKLSIACRLRGDVEHVVNAIDLLLDRRRDGGGDDLGGSAGIDRRDVHRWRRDLRIFGDRQRSLRNGAGDGQDDRKHRGEDRAVDEKMGKAHGGAPPLLDQLEAESAESVIAPSFGATIAPGRTNGLAIPSITTRSLSESPPRMTRKFS